jgi:hypothetical protein
MHTKRSHLQVVFLLLFFQNIIFADPSSFLARSSRTDPVHALSNFTRHSMRSEGADTVRVLAMRVQFKKDTTPASDGNGLFDLSDSSAYDFDRPPHNRTYFQNQLTALSNYFGQVSNQKLIIQSEVLPAGEDSCYSLANEMAYYSGYADPTLRSARWAELFRDTIQKAVEQESIDFSKYNVFVIFHAGVGSDFSFDYDVTPYDIQSVFLDFETLKETIGAGNDQYAGIPAGNAFYIKEGIILPEWQNQNGYNLGLLGSMTLLMGSQLGMPNLFDTQTGRAGVGRWDLMDQGSYNGQGLIPAEPCAFSKLYMGWEEPVVLSNAVDLKIGVSKTNDYPHVIKIPITSSEYFLVENRQRDWDGNGRTFGWDTAGMRVQFDSTGKVSWEPADSHPGVITRISEYDYGLPGSGLLIWHIDEAIIREKLAANQINTDRDHRGVDLEECDGAQDIGYYYTFFDAGYGTESGDYFDPFWAGNESHKIVNDATVVEFSSKTIPNSNSYNDGVTHIRIYNISDNDSVMTFSIATDLAQKGFETPHQTARTFSNGALTAVRLQNGASTAILAAADNGDILAWKSDGSALIANKETVTIKDVTGHDVIYPLPVLARAQNPVHLPPAACDLNGDGNDEVTVVDEKGFVYLWSCQDQDSDSLADLLAFFELPDPVSAGPMILDATDWQNRTIVLGTEKGDVYFLTLQNNELKMNSRIQLDAGSVSGLAMMAPGFAGAIVVTENRTVFNVSVDGGILWQKALHGDGTRCQPLVLYSENPQDVSVFVMANTGVLYSLDADGNLKNASNAIDTPDNLNSPALGNADGDNDYEILSTFGDDLWAFKRTHVPALNFPVRLSSAAEPVDYSPLFIQGATLRQDVILTAAPDGLMYAFNPTGKKCNDFPMCAGDGFMSTPVLTDIDGDNGWELATMSKNGALSVWNVPFDVIGESGNWTQWGGDATRSFYTSFKGTTVTPNSELLPVKKVFCYPNPTEGNVCFIRYTLTKSAQKVNVRIYDLAGDFVTELSGDADPGDHEIEWNIVNIQSGVYLVRVEAQTPSESRVEFIKLAVVK